MACTTKIQKGIGLNCDAIPAPGTKDRAILMSIDDILGATYNTTVFPDGNVISAFTRVTTTKGYAYDGQNNSIKARERYARQNFRGVYTHEFDFIAFDVTPAAAAELEKLNKDRVVAVYEDNNKMFRVMGLNAGLRTVTNDGDTDDQDTGGGHRITMSSAEETGYPEYLGIYTGTAEAPVYDYAATKAYFNSLLVAAV